MTIRKILPLLAMTWLNAFGCIQVDQSNDDECRTDKDCPSDRKCDDGECVDAGDDNASGKGGTQNQGRGGTSSEAGGTINSETGGTRAEETGGTTGGTLAQAGKGGSGAVGSGGAGKAGQGGTGGSDPAACTPPECTENYCAMLTLWCDWGTRTGFYDSTCTSCVHTFRDGAYDLPLVYCKLTFECWYACALANESNGESAVQDCIDATCDSSNSAGTGLCQECDASDICSPPLACNLSKHQCETPGE